MDKFFNILRKGLVLGIVLTFAFVFTYVPQHFNKVPVTHALDFDTDIVTNISTAISAGANITLTTKDTVLDAIAFAIAKTIISSLIGSLITWINSGFKGSPAFVQDLKRNLLEVADRTAGEFIRGLGGIGSFICSPFQLDIQIALAIEYQRAREEKPIESCTLSGIINNIEDFYKGVSQGGLEDWITITQKPEAYTPYGQLLTARTAMRVKLANEQGQTLTEINWAQGFLSGKICEAIEGPSGPKENCVISKPGTTIANSLNKALGASQDQLVAADEINELIGALIGQLANKAITGVAGLLGLSSGTGYTYSGFEGGSYVNAAIAESAAIAGSTAGNSGLSSSVYTESITVQNEIVTLANSYITRLNAYANNTRNPEDKRSMARVLSQNAVTVRDRSLDLIPQITTIRDEFQTLETEQANPATTNERKQEIVQRQAQLHTQFVNLSAYTRTQLSDLKETWESGLI